jgi:hypothetical protein
VRPSITKPRAKPSGFTQVLRCFLRVRRGLLGLPVLAVALIGLHPSKPARAESVVVDAGLPLPLGLGVQARIGRDGVRFSLKPRRVRTVRTRTRPPHDPRVRRAPAPVAVPTDRGLAGEADRACLADLARRQVSFVSAGSVRGIRTPIEVTGPIGGVSLLSRGRRAALMDCELARTLAQTAPFMRELGITGLSYSSTYNYRNVRGSSNLSGHAYGLAIDVHAVETTIGHLDVERDYPRDGHRWQRDRRGSPAVCVGEPPRREGRLLRTLACGLRSQSSLRLVLGPDDNYDHRNHLHIEAYPGRSHERISGRSSSVYWGRRAAR